MSLSLWFTLYLHFLSFFELFENGTNPYYSTFLAVVRQIFPVWLATRITFLSFSYCSCSLSNQFWLHTSLLTPTNPDFIKCLPCSFETRAMAASELPPLTPVDTTQTTRQLSAASHPLAGSLSCLLEIIRCSTHLLSLLTAEIEPWFNRIVYPCLPPTSTDTQAL